MLLKTDAYLYFFPMATIYGMLIIPVSVYSITSGHSLLPGIATPLGHAHELIFGYALAVMTGYLLNKVPLWWIVSLMITWIFARLTFVYMPGSLVADISNTIFFSGFALAGASRFLPGAKKWRNKMFGINILLLGIAGFGTHLVVDGMALSSLYAITHAGVLMATLLMLMMGGRMLAPAVAGHIESQGGTLEARIQPRIEAALILMMLAATATYLLSVPSLIPGLLLITTASLTLVRLFRWRLWNCLQRTDLLALALGYGWIAVGLLLMGGAMVTEQSFSSAIHAITIGAIGTLTLTVMSRVWMQRSGLKPQTFVELPYVVLLISLATVLRLLSGLFNAEFILAVHMSATTMWALAFVIVILRVFWKYPGYNTRKRG